MYRTVYDNNSARGGCRQWCERPILVPVSRMDSLSKYLIVRKGDGLTVVAFLPFLYISLRL